jgi:hypothetical protein
LFAAKKSAGGATRFSEIRAGREKNNHAIAERRANKCLRIALTIEKQNLAATSAPIDSSATHTKKARGPGDFAKPSVLSALRYGVDFLWR